MPRFKAVIGMIGINPFVFVPGKVLQKIFKAAGRETGHIPVNGTINGKPYKQTLVKYSGEWRLYINTTMLKNSPNHVGETIDIAVSYDAESRLIAPPESFVAALAASKKATAIFDILPPSRKFEIVRYLANLKTTEALEKNVARAINFLLGKERFIGREKP